MAIVDDLATTILIAMLRSPAPPNSGRLALDIANAILTGKLPKHNDADVDAAIGDILSSLGAGRNAE